MFDAGKAELRPDGDPVLAQVLTVTRRNSGVVRVDGFTDSEGSPGTNRQLSEQRAVAVARWLIAHGIPAERIFIQGHGEDGPIGETPPPKAANRTGESKCLWGPMADSCSMKAKPKPR